MKLMELEEEQEATAQMENDGQKELDEDIRLFPRKCPMPLAAHGRASLTVWPA